MNSYGQIHDILYTLQYKESSNDRKKFYIAQIDTLA